MNATVAATLTCSMLTMPTGIGVSDAAQEVHARSLDSLRLLWRSSSLGRTGLLCDLAALPGINGETNWDGEGARPIPPSTVKCAQDFIHSLPFGMPNPTLSAEPDGHVSFEWYESPQRLLSVSVGSDGSLHYAALIGATSQYGTLPFLGEMPRAIEVLARRVSA